LRIVYDLDGVLRDLNAYLETLGVPYPQEWDWTHEGKNIFQIIKEDGYKALTGAPETEYCPVVRTYADEIELWTCQPPAWRELTYRWIADHLGRCKVRFLTTEEKKERLDFLIDTLLVEDSPNFKDYHRIVLIDRPYNRHIETEHRIKTPQELKELCLLRRSEQQLKA